MDRHRSPFSTSLLFTFLAIIVALLLGPSRVISILKHRSQNIIAGFRSSTSVAQIGVPKSHFGDNTTNKMTKTPVYFLSHGGPNIMFDTKHPVQPKLQEIGREIIEKVKPKGVVVFSAHWQGDGDVISVNNKEKTDLIYDYYNFPAHYHKVQYPNIGSPVLASRVLSLLSSASIPCAPTSRGLDHGVFAVSTVAFPPHTPSALTVPIVQVSLFDDPSPDAHYALGAALAPLRKEGILILVSGMAVHNLRELGMWMGRKGAADYSVSFDEALREAVESKPGERQAKMRDLMGRKDLRRAHPTVEHLLPIYVGAGAAGDDLGKRLWTMPEGSMSWAQYRFGEPEQEA